ncbi:i-AAA protease yme1 [Friedmanniomyces endolithicus]|uniref:mannan endo-1,6-alpha-mannosidase n=1 Tax=Friedmanniomyces endolithicus TaxID=329885 RepID=A0AAN6H6Q5_9PEZI|nr:i-AAA protease yme1 [Friedmanniomyces endolithicus]KAK0265960.1 i-AAA protease yme1 [Friedmanniomyces endolithicus]KAK0304664.1 i-AAA protease yme1 [Friedmanniomyces endolithicus]KAK0958222.1 i-AAA protease yme1 [Friedmanniomyces endolithicus]KAK0958521.1 i-AAA protease yme1 [Friedmanniomyces endolithicus]
MAPSASIRDASAMLAYDLMSYYQNNQSSTAVTAIGTLPAPLYWWEAGAVWGGMIDYWAYTNDTSYVHTVQQALLAQVGPKDDYMMPAYYPSLGNDDQTFWAIAALSAAEYGFPAPSFFQIAARLAHYTGNETYVTWAEKTWDWMSAVGLIDQNYNVYDGTDDTLNCSKLDHTMWSYNPSMLLYGTAMLYNFTNGSQIWEKRTTGLLESCANTFFSPSSNATSIMCEPSCEPTGTCDVDQLSFKAYTSRWMAKASIVAPYIAGSVSVLLTRSAEAAAQACSGGASGSMCGVKWYVGGFDGVTGVGQELSALETVQALLLLRDGGVDAARRYPLTSEDVHVSVASSPTSTFLIPPKTCAIESATGTSSASSESWRLRSAVSIPAQLMLGLGTGVWFAR